MDRQEASDSGDGEKQMPCACTLFESRANILYILSVPIQFALLLFRYNFLLWLSWSGPCTACIYLKYFYYK